MDFEGESFELEEVADRTQYEETQYAAEAQLWAGDTADKVAVTC